MRIIAGKMRGRKLVAPSNDKVRPTSDLVKESLFNIIAGDLNEDSIVYDLFAGSGSLGIEAISRGVKKVYFSDNSRESIALLKKNIEICKAQENCSIIPNGYETALSKMLEKADVVFIDPPYALELGKACTDQLIAMDKLQVGAIIVIEHGQSDLLKGLSDLLFLMKSKKYGKKAISIFRYGSEE